MAIAKDDAEGAGTDAALSDSPPRTGAWTHLTGVYDNSENEIRLYVDGRLQDTATHENDWPADGDFTVGRALLAGAPIQGLRGTVDDVRAFDRALTGSEVRSLARGA
jgi:concanavalin A-like lectin/glucanase superfamily protein